MSASAHVIVVDDEPEIRDLLRDYLVRHGFAVSVAADGAGMRAILAERPAHIVILDLMMPGEDGISLARDLRTTAGLGVILLTAVTDVIDRVAGLEAGADDYVTKPFDPRELLARVRSVLSRVSEPSERPAGAMGREVRMGRATLSLETGRLYALSGEEIPLTAMELDLLRAFAERPHRILSRDQILEIAHNRPMEPFDRSVDLRIMRLRRKIELDPEHPQVLKTVRGHGYVFVPHGRGEPG